MFKLKPAAGNPTDSRPLLCQACEQAPAAFLCKADDASLCAACDSDIHNANPLARRHRRIPIDHPSIDGDDDEFLTNDDGDQTTVDDDEAASWLLPNGGAGDQKHHHHHSVEMLFGGVMDEYLDLDDYNSNNKSCQFVNLQGQRYGGVPRKGHGEDSVVPIQDHRAKGQVQDHAFQYDDSYIGYNVTNSVSQNVSFSSMEVGVVPESTAGTNEGSIISSNQRHPKGTIDLFSGCHVQVMPIQLSAEDREARLLRYREKKKSRKFEKTIRYASRKAYAEVRPRIKGRFAKRADAGEVQMVSESGMSGSAYGVVPSLF